MPIQSKKEKAIKLRLAGHSYGEIAKILVVAKSTVSQWCRSLTLPRMVQDIIDSRAKASRTRLRAYAKQKSQAIRKENAEITRVAIAEMGQITNKELMILGTALYWAEGYKIEKQKYPNISFCNSDPAMVSIFLLFLRKIIRAEDQKLYLTVRIYPGMDVDETLNFWSNIAQIPAARIHIEYQISSASKAKRPVNSLPFGTLRIQLRGRQPAFLIKGWIEGMKALA